MTALISNTVLPAFYEALACSLNISKNISQNSLSALDKITGADAKAWLIAVPEKITYENGLSVLNSISATCAKIPAGFKGAFENNRETMILAGAIGGTFYLCDVVLKNIPIVNRMNPNLRAAFAGTFGIGIVAAGRVFLQIDNSFDEVTNVALRVGVIAVGSGVVISSTQVGLRILKASSEKISSALEFLRWPVVEKVNFSSDQSGKNASPSKKKVDLTAADKRTNKRTPKKRSAPLVEIRDPFMDGRIKKTVVAATSMSNVAQADISGSSASDDDESGSVSSNKGASKLQLSDDDQGTSQDAIVTANPKLQLSDDDA